MPGSRSLRYRSAGDDSAAECSPSRRAAFVHGLAAELLTQLVHRAFCRRTLARALVDEIGRIAFAGRTDVADADTQKPERRAGRFLAQAISGGAKDAIGQLCWHVQRNASRSNLERRCFQLEDHRAPADFG